MSEIIVKRFCGRNFTQSEIDHTLLIAKRYQNLTRSELAETVCEHLDWKSPTGNNKTKSCMRFLEILEGENLTTLPKKQGRLKRSSKPIEVTSATDPQTAIVKSLRELQPITLVVVSNKSDKSLWNEYIERYHYLGYKRLQGRTLRYFILTENQPIGCLLISRAVQGLETRDQWIGWSYQRRLDNLPWVINNARFLLFPWVKVPHLASHVLGMLSRQVCQDYEEVWGYRPLLLETFVDEQRYAGTCYKAANWIKVGYTKGIGLIRKNYDYTTNKKLIFLYPLVKNAQKLLCGGKLVGYQGEY